MIALFVGMQRIGSKPPAGESAQAQTETKQDIHQRNPPEMVNASAESEIVKALNAIKEQREAERREARANDRRWWPPSPSWAIVYVTFAYVFIAAFQWGAIRRQANIGDRTLLLQFRPKLIVRNVVINPLENTRPATPIIQRGFPVQGQFYISNIGGSPAKDIEVGCWVEWHRTLPMRRPYETKDANCPPWKTTLNVGESTACSLPAGAVFDDDTVIQSILYEADWTAWSLYIMGWVEYHDTSGTRRRTAFCRRYNGLKQRCLVVDDPDYEHVE
jgi:hypothetical protein